MTIDLGDWVQLPAEITGDLAEQVHAVSLRAYQRQVRDGHLTVIVAYETPDGHDSPVWHLSVSHRTNSHPPQPGRRPRRLEVSDARRFLPDIKTTIGLGDAPNVVHIWQASDG